jgi:soluble lytic murein transglycosylase
MPRPTGAESSVARVRRLAVVLGAVLALANLNARSFDASGDAQAQLPAGLDPLVWRYPAALLSTLDAFGRGVTHLYSGDFAAAVAAIPDDAAGGATQINDYLWLYRAEACLGAARNQEALSLLRRHQSRYPKSPLREKAVLGEARALLQLQDPSAALAVLEKLHRGDDTDAVAVCGRALEAAGKRGEAVRLYLRIYAEYIDPARSELAEERLRALERDFLTRADNRDILLRRSENLIRAGRNQDARMLLSRLAKAKLSGRQAQEFHLFLGEALANLKKAPDALRYLRRVTDPALAARALYLQGVCQRDRRDEVALLAARDRALRLYPQSPFTERLLHTLAAFYDANNQLPLARAAYQAVVRGFPKGEFAARALWRIALYSYGERRYAEALDGFWQYLLINPGPSAAAAPAFWMGRSCERLGDLENAAYFFQRAQELTPAGYYGQRARESMAALKSSGPAAPGNPPGINFTLIRRKLGTLRPEATVIANPSEDVLRIIERSRQLAAAGLLDLALLELGQGRENSPDGNRILNFALSRVHQAKEDHLSAITTLRRAFPDYADLPASFLPNQFWEILFPVRHIDLIRESAARHGLDANLILALMRQESAFQESAHSGADARGLMQILPATGRSLAREARMARFTVSMLYQPETNIALGTRHLASLLQHNGGRVELALAAYNAGQRRVDQWLQEFGDGDVTEFVERIPFSETRGYVKQVLTSKAHYEMQTLQNSDLLPARRRE